MNIIERGKELENVEKVEKNVCFCQDTGLFLVTIILFQAVFIQVPYFINYLYQLLFHEFVQILIHFPNLIEFDFY